MSLWGDRSEVDGDGGCAAWEVELHVVGEVIVGLYGHEVVAGGECFGLLGEDRGATEVVAVDVNRGVRRRGDDLQPRGLRCDGVLVCAASREESNSEGRDLHSHSIVDGGLDEMS